MSGAGDRTHSYPTGTSTNETPTPGAYIVVVLDCENPRAPSQRHSISELNAVKIGRGEARTATRGTEEGATTLRLALADRHLSGRHAAIEQAGGAFTLSDCGSKNGTFLNGSPITSAALIDGDLIEVGCTFLLFRDGIDRYPKEPRDVDSASLGDSFFTLSPPFARHLIGASRCAATDISILISGDSGVGKEVAARWLHRMSGRTGAFTAINCGALPHNLIESELFGAKKGAYSGLDKDRMGLIRAAAAGTLFLDEIGELPPSAQVKLLRVMQEKEVIAVGDTKPVKVDVRFVSATLQNVDEAVASGRFRHDLLARVAGFRFELPTLAERREDIGILVGLLLEKLRPGLDVRLDRDVGRALLVHDWPMNVRELEQVLHSAIALADGSSIGLAHLPKAVAEAAEPAGRPKSVALAEDDNELRRELEVQLRRHKGNISAVARELGRARVQIRRWCTRFDIDVESFR